MTSYELLQTLKGIHPGFYLGQELKKQSIAVSPFALSIGEYPQTLHAILKGKRNMNTPLALRIEEKLGWEEGFLMTLQVFYEIKMEKKKKRKNMKKEPHNATPDLSKIRPGIFWDTDFSKIDWTKHFRSVIEKVFFIGNEQEKKEITRFYGKEKVDMVLNEQKKFNRKSRHKRSVKHA